MVSEFIVSVLAPFARRSCHASWWIVALVALASVETLRGAEAADAENVSFTRQSQAVISRLGCNGGTCHGAVQGKNGFRLSLFGAKPADDYEQIVRGAAGRRINLLLPEQSLVLLKATGAIPHGGGQVMAVGSPDYQTLRAWIAAGAELDDPASSQVTRLVVTPAEQTLAMGAEAQLRIEAHYVDGTKADVTPLCSYTTRDDTVATVDDTGRVQATGVGDTALIVRYRDEPVAAQVLVPRGEPADYAGVAPNNFIDEFVLAKLRRLNMPAAGLADDATFLRRVSLDVTGELPTAAEVREFLADNDPNKRTKKIEELLARPGHAALWTMKFSDYVKAADYGVYADAVSDENDAPRFQAWLRARLSENLPYDELVARILTATSRDGRDLNTWAAEVESMFDGANAEQEDVKLYAERRTPDVYWLRKGAGGVSGAMQVAHAFLGLRLECAQCHRHPHDVWQQDDLLSFANLLMRVRGAGFNGNHEKRFPEVAEVAKKLNAEAKQIPEDVKKLNESEGKKLEAAAKSAGEELKKLKAESARLAGEKEQKTKQLEAHRAQADKLAADDSAEKKEGNAAEAARLRAEADKLAAEVKQLTSDEAKLQNQLEPLEAKVQQHEEFKQRVAELTRRSKYLPEVAKRMQHAEVHHVTDEIKWASITSPLGTQESRTFRLLGESEPLTVADEEDPRVKLVAWLRRPDNPFFAKAVVNRVWAHYFGRGIIDPPDHLSPLNPPTHPELLDRLCTGFIGAGYDLRWLHRQILASRTYQQSSVATATNAIDKSNYAYFHFRRLPAEVLLDALNQATGTTEKMDMKYYRWPDEMKTVEMPYLPRNEFVKFMVTQFGRPARNSAVQCDCERDEAASVLQVLSLANHPRVGEKVASAEGAIKRIVGEFEESDRRIEELFLITVSRYPDASELAACQAYVTAAESPEKGLEGILWSLINTREFLLQH